MSVRLADSIDLPYMESMQKTMKSAVNNNPFLSEYISEDMCYITDMKEYVHIYCC